MYVLCLCGRILMDFAMLPIGIRILIRHTDDDDINRINSITRLREEGAVYAWPRDAAFTVMRVHVTMHVHMMIPV